jgi:hypothetical protein
MAEKPKYRMLTVMELKHSLDAIAAKHPKNPVLIGTCICGSRILNFGDQPTVDCPKCGAETSIRPILVPVKSDD